MERELERRSLWKKVRLGDFVETSSGGTPNRSKPEYWIGGNIPWIKSGQLKDCLISDCEEFITEEGLKNSSAKYFKKGTLLLALYGATAGKLGFLGLDATSNQAVCSINPKPGSFDNKYLYYFLLSQRSEIIRDSEGGAQPNISQTYVNEIQIPLPPLETQKRISAILDKADALRLKDQELLQKYDDLAQAIFMDMFGDPVKNEKGWEVKKLGDVTQMKAGNFIAASDIYPEFIENLFPCFGGNGLRGYVKSFTHDGAFVLIGRQGALCGNVKVTSGKYHATEHAIVCSPKVEYNTIWFYYLLDFLNLNKFATGAAQPGLTVSKLEEIEIIFPPIKFQDLFSERSIKNNALKSTSEISLKKSTNLFQTLLQKAFKGELVAGSEK